MKAHQTSLIETPIRNLHHAIHPRKLKVHAGLTAAALVVLWGCNVEPEEAFYEPPKERISASLELEPSTASCQRWRQLVTAEQTGGAAAVAEALQLHFLQFGFEEIRVDPLIPSKNGDEQHVTASLRGNTRDTLLVIMQGPPSASKLVAPLTAVARHWTQRHSPEALPALTVRFAVLPISPDVGTEEVLANYLAQRPRTVAQTVAVIVLDPWASKTLTTNQATFLRFLEPLATSNNLTLTHSDATAPMKSLLAATLVQLDLPTIWLNPIGDDEGQVCDQHTQIELSVAGKLLLDLIETASRALARPADSDEISLAG